MSALLTIIWDLKPEIFYGTDIPVISNIRWYGLTWAFSFLAAHFIFTKVYNLEKRDHKELDSFFIYTLIGCIVGARLGHVLFYGPYFTDNGTGYFDKPLSILLVNEGGLASHGAGIGLLVACYLLYKKFGLPSYAWLLDRLVLTIALAGCLIRFGNFANSEIIGTPSTSPTAIAFVHSTEHILSLEYPDAIEDISYTPLDKDTTYLDQKFPGYKMSVTFKKGVKATNQSKENIFNVVIPFYNNPDEPDDLHFITPEQPILSKEGNVYSSTVYLVTRHPSQLYESISCLVIFLLLILLYFKVYKGATPDGLLTGIFFVGVFVLRFLYEFIKEDQVDHEQGWILNTGQWLSFPMVAIGVFCILLALKKNKKESLSS